MQIYNYIAKDKNGDVQRGEVEAENESAAAKVLTTRNLVPINIFKDYEKQLTIFSHISLKEKVLITRQLATMINAGLPIAQSLNTLEQQVTNKNTRKILDQVSKDVEGGSTLSMAFSHFPEMFTSLDITLISSGETSGSLDKALLRLAEQLEKEQSLLRKVRGALIYPAFICVVVVAVIALMIIYVMPQMEGLYSSFNAQLPFITRVMISISHFLTSFAPLVIIFLIALGVYVRFAIKKPAGKKAWDSLKLKLWVISDLLKKLYMARFSRTLSGLIASGVPLLDALSIVSKAVGNVVYQELIMDAAEKVKSGIALSEPLKEDPLFPPVVSQMVAVGEKTGELDNMLKNLADYFEEEVEVTVKSFSNLIEPVIIVVLGGVIGVLLVAIMMPIYGLASVLFK